MNVGIIGTGLLGRAVATRLAQTGHHVIAYNRTIAKAQELSKFGIETANSPKEVTKKSDIVIIIVKDSPAIESISFSKDGIVEGKHDNLIVANMSTISPIHSRRIAKMFSDNGIFMIDTPVMGGPPLAEKGELVVIAGGSKELFEKCMPIFRSIAQKSYHLGPNGSGHAMKLALNLQIALLAISISEGILLAKKSGLDPLIFLDVLNSTYFRTGMSINKGPKMVKGSFEPSFHLDMMQKDLDEINYTAHELGTNLPAANLANELYKNAVKSGLSELDYTGILEYLERNQD